jgi:hypothetical protein
MTIIQNRLYRIIINLIIIIYNFYLEWSLMWYVLNKVHRKISSKHSTDTVDDILLIQKKSDTTQFLWITIDHTYNIPFLRMEGFTVSDSSFLNTQIKKK